MVSTEGATQTDYAFEYWLEGTEHDFFGRIGAWIEDLEDTLFYFFIGCVSCLGIMILCCVGLCIRSCMTRNEKIEPEDNEMQKYNQSSNKLTDANQSNLENGDGTDGVND